MIVLDCSAVLSLVFEDEGGDYADRLFDHFVAGGARVPEIWPLEVCNALVSAVRRDRLSAAEARHFFHLIGALPIEVVPGSPSLPGYASVLELSFACGLSSYDAAYLALAMDHGLPLATLDDVLTRAAQAAGAALFGRNG